MTQATFTSDEKIVSDLKDMCDFHYKMEERQCVEISFYDESSVFGGTIRRNNQKKQIIELIAKLKKLKHLNIRKCKINDLPEIKSKNLEYLDLSCNEINSIPNWVFLQPNLRFLNLGSNKIESIPDLSFLPLETLKLHKNKITTMPKLGKELKSLNVFLNPMIEFPEKILDLSLLEVLSFGFTKTKKLPQISSLMNLRWLTIAVNEIEVIPDDICQIKKLEGLILAKNKIKELPKMIGTMDLKYLTIYSNNIKKLPESFFELKLKKLNLAMNPLKDKKKVIETFKDIEFLRTT